ncbi:MAG TPA: IS200/IS605 family transposase [Vicinamibacterales bacterium]
MSHRFTSLLTHIIFSTKDRFPHLDRDLAPECHAYMGGIIENCGGQPIIVGGSADHVHLLLDLPVTQSVADAVRMLKSNSSKWIHDKWPNRSKFQWQRGYAAFAVSRSARDRVISYIDRQEQHHRKITYQDEVRRFLMQHGLEPDERYMWE